VSRVDDGGPPEVLAAGSEELGIDEEVQAAVEGSAVVVWLGDHRLLLGAVGCLVVLLAAGIHYVATRPPALDPIVHVSSVALQGTQVSDVDAQGRPRAASGYVVSTRVPGDVDVLVGVIGPGLVDPTSTVTEVTSTHPGIGNIGATVSCADSNWWSAKDSDYRVPVRRTDKYGRVTTSVVPLDASTAIRWHGWIRHECLAVFFHTLPAAVANPIPAKHPNKVDFTLTLTNSTMHAVWVLGTDYTDGTVVTAPLVEPASPSLTDAAWMSLPAGGSVSVQMSIQAAGCSGGVAHVPFALTATGQPESIEAVPVLVAQTLHPLDGQQAGSWAVLDHASAARLDAELTAVCPPKG
jgi:hypothetical protein